MPVVDCCEYFPIYSQSTLQSTAFFGGLQPIGVRSVRVPFGWTAGFLARSCGVTRTIRFELLVGLSGIRLHSLVVACLVAISALHRSAYLSANQKAAIPHLSAAEQHSRAGLRAGCSESIYCKCNKTIRFRILPSFEPCTLTSFNYSCYNFTILPTFCLQMNRIIRCLTDFGAGCEGACQSQLSG